jgi:hypothetical protein
MWTLVLANIDAHFPTSGLVLVLGLLLLLSLFSKLCFHRIHSLRIESVAIDDPPILRESKHAGQQNPNPKSIGAAQSGRPFVEACGQTKPPGLAHTVCIPPYLIRHFLTGRVGYSNPEAQSSPRLARAVRCGTNPCTCTPLRFWESSRAQQGWDKTCVAVLLT